MDVRFGLSKLTSKLGTDEIACDFLLACNFTDTRLLGLNSLRFSWLRIDRGWASPYSSSLKRPCDGTSGLVRVNRRKAVFALKGLVSKDICHVFALGQRFLSRIPEVRGKSETTEHNPIFGNKTAGRGSAEPGSGRSVSVFPALPEPPVGNMRQIPEPMSTPPFSRRETAGRGVAASRCALHILNLPHTSGFCPCGRPCQLISSIR